MRTTIALFVPDGGELPVWLSGAFEDSGRCAVHVGADLTVCDLAVFATPGQLERLAGSLVAAAAAARLELFELGRWGQRIAEAGSSPGPEWAHALRLNFGTHRQSTDPGFSPSRFPWPTPPELTDEQASAILAERLSRALS